MAWVGGRKEVEVMVNPWPAAEGVPEVDLIWGRLGRKMLSHDCFEGV